MMILWVNVARTLLPRSSPSHHRGLLQFRFKSKEAKSEFNKKVHQAIVDCCDEDISAEEEHYINMADADEFTDEVVDDGSVHDESEDEGVNALVAACLGNLLKD
jgi:hypothetical protein